MNAINKLTPFIKHKILLLGMPIAEQGVMSLGNFLLSLSVMKALDIESFGIFSSLWLVLMAAFALHQAAITSPMQVYLAADDDKIKKIRTAYFIFMNIIFSLMLCFVIWLVFSIGLKFNLMSMAGKLTLEHSVLLALVIFGHLNIDFYRKLNIAHHCEWKNIVLIALGYYVPVFVFFTSVFFFEPTVLSVYSILSFSFMASMTIGFITQPHSILLGLKSVPQFFHAHWTYCKWLIASSLLQWATNNIMIISSGVFFGVTTLGIIRAVLSITGIVNLVMPLIENLLPRFTSAILKEKGSRGVIYKLLPSYIVAVLGLCMLSLIFGIFGEDIITWLVGSTYLEAQPYIIAFFPLFSLIILSAIFRTICRMQHNTKVIFKSYYVSSLATFIAGLPLTYYYGVWGWMLGALIIQATMILTLYRATV